MNKNPFLNALLAAVYIGFIVTGMHLFFWKPNTPDTQSMSILVPMVMLSLFTLSAAVMGYLFVAEPVMMYLDGKKKEAVRFFFTTVGTFAVVTIALATTLFFVI